MKRLFAVMTVIISTMVSGEIHTMNFIASTEHDPVLISQRSEIAIGKDTDRQMRKTY
jgi:hypothetical protein